ncbi:MAG: DUF4037 domain-containing protein [Candidatus Limnocylindria bacterium]
MTRSPGRAAATWKDPETARRLTIGRPLAGAYASNPHVKGVLVAGSVGRGEADRYSDLEIDVYWSASPSDAERLAPIQAVRGTLIGRLDPAEEEEWAEEFIIDAIHVGTSMFLVDTMERYLAEVVDGWSTADLPQIRIAAIQHGIALHGEVLVDRWRARAAAYPDGLRRAMVQLHLRHQVTWGSAAMLAERGDLVLLYDTIGRAVRAMLGALHGLNRLYLAHPGHKWMRRLIAEMEIAPMDLADRLASVYLLPPQESVAVLQALLEETLELVELGLPDVDVTGVHEWVMASRIRGDNADRAG